MEDFERELKQIFLDEAVQIVCDAEQCFLRLEDAPGDQQVLDKLFRLAHNLKGSSKAVGFNELGAFTHELESLLLKIKNRDIPTGNALVSLLLRCNDQISVMVAGLRDDLGAHFDCQSIIGEIVAAAAGALSASGDSSAAGSGMPASTAVPACDEPAPAEDWGVFADMPAAAPVQATPLNLAALRPSAPVTLAAAAPEPAAKSGTATDESIRISLGRLEQLIDFVGEVVILQTVLREQVATVSNDLLRKTVHQLGKVTKEVQDLSMSLRMVPVRQTFLKMQRIVRDTSASIDKKVQLVTRGEETELDKTILEKVSDPLVHLIRNAVDHGIEHPADRLAAGKPEHGTVTLTASHQSGKLVIEVGDDGRGMDPERLRASAVSKGLIRADQVLTDKEALALIFAPGFSTKAEVTDLSGRGVGMDVVKTNIEALQGEVHLDSVRGVGSTIRIVLPLTLAIIDGLIVKCKNERYVLPLSHVHESVRPGPEDIHPSAGLGPIFSLRGENMPLYSLGGLLGRPMTAQQPTDAIAIVVRVLGKPFALLVDDIHGQSQVVIKKLGSEHRDLVGFSGSAILGDGKAALILEVADLVKSKMNRAAPKNVARKVA